MYYYYYYYYISLKFFSDRKMFQTKFVEKIKTHIFVFSNCVFGNRAVYEIIWINIVQVGRPQMTIRRMRIAFCIPKTTNRHIMQYLMLLHFTNGRYTHIACLVPCIFALRHPIWA
jgi:hypothetical protein